MARTISHNFHLITRRIPYPKGVSKPKVVHTDRLKPYLGPPLKSWISDELDDRDRESHKENGDK